MTFLCGHPVDRLNTLQRELADFLGQAKPPVVTEEEIEQSGLELFKAAGLIEYVDGGRVASNCLDRVGTFLSIHTFN